MNVYSRISCGVFRPEETNVEVEERTLLRMDETSFVLKYIYVIIVIEEVERCD